MHKMLKPTLVAASVLSAFISTQSLAQQTVDNGFYINVFADYYNADWNHVRDNPAVSLGESYSFGADLGYRISPDFAVRFEYADLDLSIKGTNDSVSGSRMGFDGLWHFADLPVYGILGVKKIDAYSDFNAANLGLGAKLELAPRWTANAEATWYEGLNRDYSDHGIKLGVAYSFGDLAKAKKVEPAPVPVKETVAAPVVMEKPKDADNDGIVDANDRCPNTPIVDAVDGNGCSLYEEKEYTQRLLVKFANNASDVNSSYYEGISEVAEFMTKHVKTTVLLEGHTSAVGRAEYNKALSLKRANVLKEILVSQYGIDASRIDTIGYGEERLRNPANTKEAHAENRRVEALLNVVERVTIKR
jgi:OOP family OmpA-OmpF porin